MYKNKWEVKEYFQSYYSAYIFVQHCTERNPETDTKTERISFHEDRCLEYQWDVIDTRCLPIFQPLTDSISWLCTTRYKCKGTQNLFYAHKHLNCIHLFLRSQAEFSIKAQEPKHLCHNKEKNILVQLKATNENYFCMPVSFHLIQYQLLSEVCV